MKKRMLSKTERNRKKKDMRYKARRRERDRFYRGSKGAEVTKGLDRAMRSVD